MDNNNEHAVQDKPGADSASEDVARIRKDEEDDRWEHYAEQDLYRNTDFHPSAGWYV